MHLLRTAITPHLYVLPLVASINGTLFEHGISWINFGLVMVDDHCKIVVIVTNYTDFNTTDKITWCIFIYLYIQSNCIN